MIEVGKKSRGPLLFGASILFLAMAGMGAWIASRYFTDRPVLRWTPASEPSDPRRSYTGPYRNIHPDIRYVNDARSTECHEQIARSFAAHPMGRSLVPVASL